MKEDSNSYYREYYRQNKISILKRQKDNYKKRKESEEWKAKAKIRRQKWYIKNHDRIKKDREEQIMFEKNEIPESKFKELLIKLNNDLTEEEKIKKKEERARKAREQYKIKDIKNIEKFNSFCKEFKIKKEKEDN